jgi:hypothetical protein
MHLPSTAMHIFGLACMPPHIKQQCCRCRCVVLSGLCSSDPGEEVCVTYSNALVRINTLDLRSQVRHIAVRLLALLVLQWFLGSNRCELVTSN